MAFGDGAGGWQERAPYDRIILTVGAGDRVPAWAEQLAPGGRLLLPLSLREVQRSVAFEPAGDHLASVSVLSRGLMPLRGALAEPQTSRPLGAGLLLELEGERRLDAVGLHAALGQLGDVVPMGLRVAAGEVGRRPGVVAGAARAGRRPAPRVRRGRRPGLGAAPADLGRLGRHRSPCRRAGSGGSGPRPAARGAAVRREDALTGPARSSSSCARAAPAAGELALRLAEAVRRWGAAGRPATAGTRIRACPAGATGDRAGAAVLDNQHTRLLLDWPKHRSSNST